jgi:D-alanine-D-alanine ligase-like ATP-grasp enzyme
MPHYNQIYANIKTALREMMPSLVQNLQSKSHKSEYWLAGVDFVIDKYLNPWLLELNCNPGVSCITKNVNIYKGSVPDLLDLAIIPLTGCGIKPKLGGYSRVY